MAPTTHSPPTTPPAAPTVTPHEPTPHPMALPQRPDIHLLTSSAARIEVPSLPQPPGYYTHLRTAAFEWSVGTWLSPRRVGSSSNQPGLTFGIPPSSDPIDHFLVHSVTEIEHTSAAMTVPPPAAAFWQRCTRRTGEWHPDDATQPPSDAED